MLAAQGRRVYGLRLTPGAPHPLACQPVPCPKCKHRTPTSNQHAPANRQLPHQDEYRDAPGSVISADFYHANALLPLSDEAIVQRVVEHVAKCEPGFKGAWVGGAWDGRRSGAVVWQLWGKSAGRWASNQVSARRMVRLPDISTAPFDTGNAPHGCTPSLTLRPVGLYGPYAGCGAPSLDAFPPSRR